MEVAGAAGVAGEGAGEFGLTAPVFVFCSGGSIGNGEFEHGSDRAFVVGQIHPLVL